MADPHTDGMVYINMTFKTEYEGVDSIQLAQGIVLWHALTNTPVNHQAA
jgi:hypothetical protein